MIDFSAERTTRGKAEPSVLMRKLTTPPSLPWDQARAARLEAARMAPSRDLAVRTRRLAAWRPGAQGNFAAFYVRAEEVGDGFTARQQLDGRQVAVRFGPEGETGLRTGLGVSLALLAGGVVLAVMAGEQALDIRVSREASLQVAEQSAAHALARAQGVDRTAQAAERIAAMPDSGAPVSVVLRDLATMMEARDTAVGIEAVHWRPDGIAVEVRSEDKPYADNAAERSRRPLHAGVWLWARPNEPEKAGQP